MNTDTCETECTPPSRFRMVDLFTGIGGFSLAASWVWGDELEIVAFCEIDKFCQRVLKKHWPDVPIIEDIREVTGETITNAYRNRLQKQGAEQQTDRDRQFYEDTTIDLLTGGFPCQPFSCAGKRKGRDDDRYLWPELLRIVHEIQPAFCLFENVGGIFTQEQGMVFGQVLSDLENEGYEVQPFCIPACAKNAPHRRDRFWFVANRTEQGLSKSRLAGIRKLSEEEREGMDDRFKHSDCHAADTDGTRSTIGLSGQDNGQEGYSGESYYGCQEHNGWQENWLAVATSLCRVDDGVPNRVDRLKSLGNSIVPQVAYEIMKGIKEVGF